MSKFKSLVKVKKSDNVYNFSNKLPKVGLSDKLPDEKEREKEYQGSLDISTPDDAVKAINIGKKTLDKKHYRKLVKDIAKRHNISKNISKPVKESVGDLFEKELSTRGRRRLKKKQFALEPDKDDKNRRFKGSYPIDTPDRARSALSYGSRYLGSDDFLKLAQKVYKRYKFKPSLRILNKFDIDPKRFGYSEESNVSLYDRIMNEADQVEEEYGHKMSGAPGRYQALLAKRKKEKLGHGDEKKMGPKDAGAEMSKAGFKDKKMAEGKHMDYDEKDMKKKKKKKNMDYDYEEEFEGADIDESEEEVEEAYYGSNTTRKQASGDSDSFFAWSQKRKPKSMKVRPKGSTWDYNPVPVHPDQNHGKVKIEDEDDELTQVSESLEELRKVIFG